MRTLGLVLLLAGGSLLAAGSAAATDDCTLTGIPVGYGQVNVCLLDDHRAYTSSYETWNDTPAYLFANEYLAQGGHYVAVTAIADAMQYGNRYCAPCYTTNATRADLVLYGSSSLPGLSRFGADAQLFQWNYQSPTLTSTSTIVRGSAELNGQRVQLVYTQWGNGATTCSERLFLVHTGTGQVQVLPVQPCVVRIPYLPRFPDVDGAGI